MSILEINKRTAEQFFSAQETGDGQTLMGLLDPEFCFITTGTSIVSGERTLKDLPDMAKAMKKIFPNGLKFLISSLTAEENRVVCQVASNGTTADGQEYKNNYIFLMEFNEGKIRKVTEYLDTKLVDKVFGPILMRKS